MIGWTTYIREYKIHLGSMHTNHTGVYIFHSPQGGGDDKNMSYCLVGEKYDDLLRKNANIRGKRWKKKGKRGNFHCTWGKKYHYGKRGEGKNINYLDNIHPRSHVFNKGK